MSRPGGVCPGKADVRRPIAATDWPRRGRRWTDELAEVNRIPWPCSLPTDSSMDSRTIPHPGTTQTRQSVQTGSRVSPMHASTYHTGVPRKVKVAHTRLSSVGFRSWCRFLAVSLQVTWVINQAVGCHYFQPGPQLPPQPLKGLLPILLLGEQRHDGCEQFA